MWYDMICMFYNCRNCYYMVEGSAVAHVKVGPGLDSSVALGGVQRRSIPSMVYHV